MASELAVVDRLGDLQLELEKVNGTLATILSVGNPESMIGPSPREFLNLVQMLEDAISPASEELGAIVQEIEQKRDTPPESPRPPQGLRARVKQKGR